MCRTEEHPAYFVALAGRISDRFEELHRKLLFFDPDDIEDAVKLIDHQRSFWKKSENPEFYDEHLLSALENRVPDNNVKNREVSETVT